MAIHDPVGPVNRVDEIFADPHVKVRGMLAEVEHYGSKKKFVIANTPIHMSATQGGVRRRAPFVGEHTDQILQDAGFNSDEIASFHADDIIK